MASNFSKMGLLDKAKVLERAKVLAHDKANILKTGLKEATMQEDLIQSKFAQKLPNGSYLCLACKVKCGDHILAVKHFASADHRTQLDTLKLKAGQVLAATSKDPIAPLPSVAQPPSEA